MPYTYRKQSPQMLYDIHNYYTDYALVDEYYSHNYNHYMWLVDIVSFFKKDVDKILHRHVYYKDQDDSALIGIVFDLYYKNLGRDVERKVRFLWGLLLPIERTRFINTILLEY